MSVLVVLKVIFKVSMSSKVTQTYLISRFKSNCSWASSILEISELQTSLGDGDTCSHFHPKLHLLLANDKSTEVSYILQEG